MDGLDQTSLPPRLMDIHLASSSPRRHEILAALGVKFAAAGVDVDETRYDGEPVAHMVVRLAVAKATAAREYVDPDRDFFE